MGELSALACAFLWASSTIALRSQTGRVNVLALNAIRSAIASVVFVGIFLATGPVSRILEPPALAVLLLLTSMVFGLALGDTLYFRSMHLIGVSRAMPISASYPLLTTLIAGPLLGEAIGGRTLIGVVLVIAGVYLVAVPSKSRDRPVESQSSGLGVGLALAASVCWSISTILMKPALDDIDAIVANAMRLPIGTLILGLIAHRHLSSV
ncbi:MAG TPA: GRP family sugar transporter, partial [Chloroflexota bacterium]|nr:GRP family sugar transporter [Chloroflexota bacterium]